MVSLAIFLTGLPISYYAAPSAAWTWTCWRAAPASATSGRPSPRSIYASFTFIFFGAGSGHHGAGLRTVARAAAIIGLPVRLAIVVIPLVTPG
ncbi:hypothetical protein ACU4GD_19950 [Cupriavidus basilensis]